METSYYPMRPCPRCGNPTDYLYPSGVSKEYEPGVCKACKLLLSRQRVILTGIVH